ncbi:carboxylate--amine ligase [Streptomyces longispororuber]|uniref:carboxylate--amine ligase n=1 Tax=Streptomyces longispororuber TaxID=68230 RepID=UPI00167D8ACD|nr:ATP-grasp domain-containing protein [Streptomyces longispororuber]
MQRLDTRVPAVLLRTDRNSFHHGTLGAVRSLGRAGVEVHLVADDAHTPVSRSRYLHRLHRPARPDAPLTEVAATLRRVAADLRAPAVLIPLDDAGALAVNTLRSELSGPYLLPEMADGTAESVADKAVLARLCASAGVPHPRTEMPRSAGQAADAARSLGPTAVAKWSRPWCLPRGAGLHSTVLVRSPHEAAALFARGGEAGCPLLIQAFVAARGGADWFVHGYVGRDGRVHAGGTGRKLSAWPRSAGITVRGEWTPNPALQEAAARLLTRIGYRGVFDLDFRADAATGTYHLLDFNPRPGAQFRLFADAADLDVVRAQHLDLTGRPVPPSSPLPGRTFVVENYAPLSALRPGQRPAPRELAWHADDDRAPGQALRRLWSRHALGKLGGRVPRHLRGPWLRGPVRLPRPAPPVLPGPASGREGAGAGCDRAGRGG